jgi:HEAT repeat protein
LMLSELRGNANAKRAGAAIDYFAKTGDEAALPDLLALVNDTNDETSTRALTALAEYRDPAAHEAIRAVANVRGPRQGNALTLLNNFPGSADEVRAISLDVLRRGDVKASGVIHFLAQDSSPEAQAALADLARSGGSNGIIAMNQLVQRGDGSSAALVQGIASQPGANRMAALRLLGTTGDPRSLATLTDAMRDSDPKVRRAAIEGLGQLHTPEANRAIEQAASSGDPHVRSAAVDALGNGNGDPQTSGPALEKLTNDRDREVANDAFGALARVDPARAAPIVERDMQNGNWENVASEIGFVQQLDGASQQRIFTTALNNADDSTVLMNAAVGLGELGTDDAEKTLIDILTKSSASDGAHQAAAHALNARGGSVKAQYENLITKYLGQDATSASDDDSDSEGE